MKIPRLYVHGDVYETDENKCYCARCDDFVDDRHFREDPFHQDGEADYKRYLRDMKTLPTKLQNLNGEYQRPPNARNRLA